MMWTRRSGRPAAVIVAGLVVSAATTAGLASAAATELVVNGSLESGGAMPTCFQLTGWGTNTYTAEATTSDAHTGARSWQLKMMERTSGDRKLMISEREECAPSVTPGKRYDVSVWYRSTAASNGLTIFRQTASGWEYWTDLRDLPAADSWTKAAATTPIVPVGTLRLSFGVSLASPGTLLTDDYSVTLSEEAPPPTEEGVRGWWSIAAYTLPSRSTHTTLLSNGKVLLIAGSGNDGAQFAAGTFRAEVWDPTTGTFTPLDVPEDMWCGGHVTLRDGRVLIMGGTKSYPNPATGKNFTGLKSSFIFDPDTNQFTKINDVQTGHWYPTLTKLGNGNVWAAGGLNENAEGTVATEIYSSSQNRWLSGGEVHQTWNYWGTYPHMILLQDGRLFYSGAHTFGQNIGTGAALYNTATGVIEDVPGLRMPGTRDQAGSAMLPPAQQQRVAIFGGGDTENNAAGIPLTDVIDLTQVSPHYHGAQDMPGLGKGYVNTVILPDRTVLTTGGARHNRTDEVNTSALFNPITESWTSAADNPLARQYHSSAVLLPDGRVVTLGGNPADNTWELRISIYEPPYFFRGTRPSLVDAPTLAQRGSEAQIQATGEVQYVNLIAPMSVTHQTDPNMRLVDVPFVRQPDGTLTLTIPDNPNLLPPGPYMLSVVDSNGIPSKARWVTVS
jgi:Galactose oxidase-like, Early set domain